MGIQTKSQWIMGRIAHEFGITDRAKCLKVADAILSYLDTSKSDFEPQVIKADSQPVQKADKNITLALLGYKLDYFLGKQQFGTHRNLKAIRKQVENDERKDYTEICNMLNGIGIEIMRPANQFIIQYR